MLSAKYVVSINSQLPSQFYSFWKININDLNTIEDTTEVLFLMHQLNHVFYVALKNGNNTPELFYNFLVEKLEIENENVFNNSNRQTTTIENSLATQILMAPTPAHQDAHKLGIYQKAGRLPLIFVLRKNFQLLLFDVLYYQKHSHSHSHFLFFPFMSIYLFCVSIH